MATDHTSDEANIRQRITEWADAIRAMDLDSVMPIYAPDVVSFDLDGTLRYVGTDAKRARWGMVFAMFQRPIAYEVRDLTLTIGDDVAFGHSLNRITGTLKNGKTTGFWLRWTMCFRKIDGSWL